MWWRTTSMLAFILAATLALADKQEYFSGELNADWHA